MCMIKRAYKIVQNSMAADCEVELYLEDSLVIARHWLNATDGNAWGQAWISWLSEADALAYARRIAEQEQ